MYNADFVDAWNKQAKIFKTQYVSGIPSVLEVIVTNYGADRFDVPQYTAINLVGVGSFQNPVWKFGLMDFSFEELIDLKSQGKILSYDIEALNIVSELINWAMLVDDHYGYYCPDSLADICKIVNKYGIINTTTALGCMYGKSGRDFIMLAKNSIAQSFPFGFRDAMVLAVIPEVVNQLYVA